MALIEKLAQQIYKSTTKSRAHETSKHTCELSRELQHGAVSAMENGGLHNGGFVGDGAHTMTSYGDAKNDDRVTSSSGHSHSFAGKATGKLVLDYFH